MFVGNLGASSPRHDVAPGAPARQGGTIQHGSCDKRRYEQVGK